MGDIVNISLHHNLSLQRLSLTVLITTIYEDPVIKYYLKNEMARDRANKSAIFFKTLENEITRLACERIGLLPMPKSLILEALNIAIILGKKIVKWAEYVIYGLSLDMSYLDEIHWTYFGILDRAKIYNAYWKKHVNFSEILNNEKNLILKIYDHNYKYACFLACSHGNEKAILYHQDEIIKRVERGLYLFGDETMPDIRHKVDLLAATYLYYMYGQNYDIEKDQSVVYQVFQASGKVTFTQSILACAVSGDALAVKFLWKFLKEFEKENVKIELAGDCLDYGFQCCGISGCELWDENDNTADTVLFLINQMTLEQKNEFLRKHASELLQLFSQVWPYQEICLKLLDEQLVREIISQDGKELSSTLLSCMVIDFADLSLIPEACTQETVFHKLLAKVFSLVPKVSKELVLFDEQYYKIKDWIFPDAIQQFYEVFDVNSLKIIINDEDLKEERDLMIRIGLGKISELIEKGELKIIVCFLERVLINKDERKLFIRKWNLENHPVVADHPDIQEKISTWLKA